MIGDWVLYKGEPIMVWEIDDYYNRINTEPDGYNAITCVEISDIKPIPLTAEILEKNGFEFNNLPMEQCWQQYGLRLYLSGHGYGINCGENVSLCIDYVHELQHALRLCGIDKEIEL